MNKQLQYIRQVIVILLVFTVSGVQAQVTNQNESKKIYTDRVTDESGRPIVGITVRVQGKSKSVRTNSKGEFSIEASYGDVIVLSKDGTIINTYTYDGSPQYRIYDKNETIKEADRKIENRRSTVLSVTSLLDSAKFYQKTKPTKSVDFIENALRQTDVNKDKIQVAEAYEILGDVNMNLKQFDIAVGNYQMAMNQNSTPRLEIKLANALTKNKQYDESERHWLQLQEVGKLTSAQRILVYEGRGDVFVERADLDNGFAQYQLGLKLAEQTKDVQKSRSLNAKIALLLERKGETKKAENFLLKSQAAASTSKREAIIEQRNAADFYSRNNNIEKEVVQRKATLDDFEKFSLDTVVVDNAVLTKPKAKLDLGNAYLKQKDFGKAITLLEESATEAEEADDIFTQKDAVEKLSEAYVSLGDDDKALENYKQYVALVDKVYKQKEDEINAVVALNKELSDKQNRINSLEKDRALTQSNYDLAMSQKELTVENDRRQKVIIYALIAGVLLLLFSLFWMIKSNRQRKLANNLLALKSLRTQMNPHFIFNALNSVNSFIAQNDERTANRYLTDFSTLMRSVLNNSDEDFIPLEKEIDLLSLYLKLEHSRFKDKFTYEVKVDEAIDLHAFEIPPMLLQPYVENAVWHGLRYKKEIGQLTIQVQYIDNATIRIVIADNGIGRKQSKALKTEYQKKQKSKGMQNIKQRIDILNEMYKDRVEVQIGNLHEDETGTKVTLTLKKE